MVSRRRARRESHLGVSTEHHIAGASVKMSDKNDVMAYVDANQDLILRTLDGELLAKYQQLRERHLASGQTIPTSSKHHNRAAKARAKEQPRLVHKKADRVEQVDDGQKVKPLAPRTTNAQQPRKYAKRGKKKKNRNNPNKQGCKAEQQQQTAKVNPPPRGSTSA